MGCFLLLLLCCFSSLAWCLAPPVLPSSFVATFTNPVDPFVPLTGTWYYDFDKQVQRIDGGNQLSCNRVNNNKAEYCTTFLTPSHFYIIFPFRNACCVESSPGLLRPDWLVHDNATFVGEERILHRVCDVWLAMGSSKNYWIAERKTGFPCRLVRNGRRRMKKEERRKKKERRKEEQK